MKDWLLSDKTMLFFLVILLLWFWLWTRSDDLIRIIDTATGALIGLATGRLLKKEE